ncbi:hypothetical protein N9D31_00930 [Oligoflexaceae bacterium]|nr:hypothetical protein [Oligoflexaceae bacterium]
MAICRNISILCLGVLCKLSVACGPVDEDRRQKPEIFDRPEFTLLGPADYYFLADEECQQQEEPRKTAIEEITVYKATAEGSEAEVINPIGFTSQKSLKTPAVKETFYGGVYEADCREKNIENCQNAYLNVRTWNIIKKRKPLRVCQPKSNFKRFSFESMALTASQNINRAAQAAMQYADMKLPPVILEVIPNFRVRKEQTDAEGVVKDALLYATRQMSYFAGSGSIAVYPERPESSQEKPQFWESEFVASHEFGHHIEAQIRKASRGAEVQKMVGGGSRLVEKAVSEAFADLMAFYTLDQNPNALEEFPDAYLDRNPAQPIFSDSQTVKVLSQKIMKRFIAQKNDGNKEMVNLTRLHLIGAIVSHSLHKIFTQISAAKSGDINSIEVPRSKEKYGLTIRWFKLYSAELSKKKNADDKSPYSALARSIRKIISDVDRDDRVKVNRTFSTNLPGLYEI